MKRLIQILVVALVFSVVLVGCSSEGNNSSSSGKSKESGSSEDTLVYARGADAITLAPVEATDTESTKVTNNIYETLIDYGKTDFSLHPGLATKWEKANHGLTYTFHLRKGVKFQDGTDFNADAVVYNFKRWMSGGHGGRFARFETFFGFKNQKNAVIKNVKATDKYTVVFTLNKPFGPFLNNIAMSSFPIISPTALKKYGKDISKHPVGTGPFKLKDWKQNDTITLVKNDHYWKKGYPKLQKIIFKVIPDNSSRLNALKTGEVDMVDGIDPSDVKGVQKNSNLKVYVAKPNSFGYLGFDVRKKPFNNKKVRQALSHAIDKKAIANAFFAGYAEPGSSVLTPITLGYDKKLEGNELNIGKAKNLLKEAGYPNGFKMTLWSMPNPRPYMAEPQKIAQSIQSDFSKIGVKVEIKTLDWSTYTDKITKGELPAFLLGAISDNGDPDEVTYNMLDKNNFGHNNYTRYASEKVHKLNIKGQLEINEDKRADIYKRIQEIVHEDAPMIPIVYAKEEVIANNNIQGFVPSPRTYPKFTDVYFK